MPVTHNRENLYHYSSKPKNGKKCKKCFYSYVQGEDRRCSFLDDQGLDGKVKDEASCDAFDKRYKEATA